MRFPRTLSLTVVSILKNGQSETTKGRNHFRSVPFANTALILTKRDVQCVVKTVLNSPVISKVCGDFLNARFKTANEVALLFLLCAISQPAREIRKLAPILDVRAPLGRVSECSPTGRNNRWPSGNLEDPFQ